MDQTSQSKNSQDEIAISVKGLSKAYRIWRDASARLKAPLWDALGSFIPSALRPKALKQRLSHEGKSRYYTDFYALDKLNIEIKKGEAVGIIGRNGSGKSTLLQMIAGTLTPTTGEIQVNGRVAALLELGSGFNPEFTGRENVYMNASVLGLKESEIDAKLQAILDFADIGDFIDQPVKTYSSGMNMRLAFAVIAHVDADILIVDEALAVGDVFFVQKCMSYIRKFKSKGTLLMVTHDATTALSLCDRGIWLDSGECRMDDSSKLTTEAYLKAIYSRKQEITLFKRKEAPTEKETSRTTPKQDHRNSLLRRSNLQNTLQIFEFDPHSSGFGTDEVKINSVKILNDHNGEQIDVTEGGEDVVLCISIEAHRRLNSPIVGFHLKNRLGQQLFGDNSYLTYLTNPVSVENGEALEALFHFQMPYLPAGDYMFSVACAEGTQEDHVQLQWLHEALPITSTASHISGALIGIPITQIQLHSIN